MVTGGTLGGIQGVVTVTGDGSDTLNADDSGVNSAVTLNVSASVVSASNAANINYSGLSNLNLNLGSGNNVITVTGTSATTNSTITTGNGNNTFTVVPSTNTPTAGLLTLAGPLTLSPGTGSNSLTVNDSADPLVRSVTVTGTTISGLGGPINYSNFLNLTILLGTASGNSVTVNNSAGPLPLNTTIQNGSTTGGTATITYTGDFNGNLNLVNFANGSVVVTGNFNGNLTASALGSVTVGVFPGSPTDPTSGNFFGNLTVTGLLGAVTIYGGIDSGMITAGSVGTIYAPHLISDPGLVFQVTQGGVLRQIQAGVPTGTGGGGIFSYYNQLSSSVTFAILYDGSTLSTAPQAAIRVTNNPGGTAFPLDLALTSSSLSAKFDLSRVDATTTYSGIQSLSVEGDLLTTLTGPEKTFLGYSSTTTGGVFLPNDTLLDVAVRDNAALASVTISGIMAAAFASLGGTPYASLSSTTIRTGLFAINPSTNKPYGQTVYITGRMRIPVGLGTVGLFMDNEPDGDADFDGEAATFTNASSPAAPVTAFLTFVNTQPAQKPQIQNLQIQNLAFLGQGGSINTSIPVLSTGAMATVTVADAGGTFTGSPFAATATVAGVSGIPAGSLEGVTPTLTYYAGTTTTGTPLTGAPSAVGTYTVMAKFAGSADYASATSNPLTFKITAATPTVNISDAGGGFTGSPFAATATVTGVSGNPAASLEGVTLTLTYYAGNTATGTPLSGAPSAIGTYTVVAKFAGSSDYASVTSTSVTFTITPATPVLTVNDAGGAFTGSLFAATATVTGGSGIPAASLEGVTPTLTYYAGSTPTGTPLTGAPIAIGTYTVVATFAGSSDYTSATSNPVTFTINAATPVVTVSDAGGAFTGSPFAATATMTGVSGVPAASLEGVTPTLTYYAGSTATGTPLTGAPGAIGTYTVVASFAGSTDYTSATSAPVTFNITATPTEGILLLDPTGKNALQETGGGSQVNVANGLIVVDSSSPQAVNVGPGTTLTANEVDVTGNVQPGGTINATVKKGTTPLADPFVGLAAPTTSGLAVQSTKQYQVANNLTVTLQPGLYTGGIKIGNGDNVTLSPGIYYLNNGGFIVGNSTVTGNGVLIYDVPQGATGFQFNQSTVTLSAMTTGIYAGIAIFQARTSNAPFQVNAGTKLNITGSIYAAAAIVNINGAGVVVTISEPPSGAPPALLIAADLIDQTGAVLNVNVAPATPTPTPTPTVTLTSGNNVYTGNAYVPATTVTGSGGIDSGAIVTYTYYAGTDTTGTNLGTAAPVTVGTYTVVASFAGDSTYTAGDSSPTTFQITVATPTVTAADAGGVFNGSPFMATATVTGVSGTAAASLEGITPTFIYYTGTIATGTPLSGAPSAIGTYTVVASFAGSADYASATSSPVTFKITAAGSSTLGIVLLDKTGSGALNLGGPAAAR